MVFHLTSSVSVFIFVVPICQRSFRFFENINFNRLKWLYQKPCRLFENINFNRLKWLYQKPCRLFENINFNRLKWLCQRSFFFTISPFYWLFCNFNIEISCLFFKYCSKNFQLFSILFCWAYGTRTHNSRTKILRVTITPKPNI